MPVHRVRPCAGIFSGKISETLQFGAALCWTDLDYEEGAVGAWREAESPALTGEAQAAFDKAAAGFVGVDYVPVALLSTQTVAAPTIASCARRRWCTTRALRCTMRWWMCTKAWRATRTSSARPMGM